MGTHSSPTSRRCPRQSSIPRPHSAHRWPLLLLQQVVRLLLRTQHWQGSRRPGHADVHTAFPHTPPGHCPVLTSSGPLWNRIPLLALSLQPAELSHCPTYYVTARHSPSVMGPTAKTSDPTGRVVGGATTHVCGSGWCGRQRSAEPDRSLWPCFCETGLIEAGGGPCVVRSRECAEPGLHAGFCADRKLPLGQGGTPFCFVYGCVPKCQRASLS